MTGNIQTKKRVGDDGEWIETPVYLIDGKPVSAEEFKAAFPDHVILPGQTLMTPSTSAWPWVSDSLAVHSKQVEQVKARNAKHGLNIEYNKRGQPVCTDAGQRRRLMKIEGVVQQNSFNGS